jgi:hypothetical protein
VTLEEGNRSDRKSISLLDDTNPVIPASRPDGIQISNAKERSPWVDYEQTYGLLLGPGVRVTTAVQKRFPFNEVTVRKLSVSDIEGTLHIFKQAQVANVVTVLDSFRFGEMAYGIYEHMPVSLYQIANSSLLNDLRLAAVLRQVNFQDSGTATVG